MISHHHPKTRGATQHEPTETYTAASNQRYILRELWHYDRSTIFYALAEIITQIGKGFGTILIPSMIVAFLEQYQKGMITQETLPGVVAKLVTFLSDTASGAS